MRDHKRCRQQSKSRCNKILVFLTLERASNEGRPLCYCKLYRSTMHSNTASQNDHEPPPSGSEILEETWTHEDGSNVFDSIFGDCNQRGPQHRLEWSYFRVRENWIQLKSFPEASMTPLDVNSSEPLGNSDCGNGNDDERHHDGTGTIVWLASKALAWCMEQDVRQLRTKYFLPPSMKRKEQLHPRREPRSMVEMGCGTGLPGLALLSLCNDEASLQDHPIHITFTDSDDEVLQNCRVNCQRNAFAESSYAHQDLAWGRAFASDISIKPGSIDVVYAADVLYAMDMLLSFLETAALLLKDDDLTTGDSIENSGYLILSHVPRFCLPRQDPPQPENQNDANTASRPFDVLEKHIIHQAESVGFQLKDQIRPHQELKPHENPSFIKATASNEIRYRKDMDVDLLRASDLEALERLQAVIFIFQKQRGAG